MAITDILTGGNMSLDDKVISDSILMAGKGASTMYLNAILESSTPELRSIYSQGLGEILNGHAAATAIAVNNGWYKPYDSPDQQLADTFKQTVSSVQNSKK